MSNPVKINNYEQLSIRYKIYYAGIMVCTLGLTAIPTALFMSWLTSILNISADVSVRDQDGGVLWLWGLIIVGSVSMFIMAFMVSAVIRRRNGWTKKQVSDYAMYRNLPSHWLKKPKKNSSLMQQILDVNLSGKFSCYFSLSIAMFSFISMGFGLIAGEHNLLKYGNVILLSEDPGTFWSITITQAFIGIVGILIAFPTIDIRAIFRGKKRERKTAKAIVAEIEILIVYGRNQKAAKMINSLLTRYPANRKLLDLKNEISRKI